MFLTYSFGLFTGFGRYLVASGILNFDFYPQESVKHYIKTKHSGSLTIYMLLMSSLEGAVKMDMARCGLLVLFDSTNLASIGSFHWTYPRAIYLSSPQFTLAFTDLNPECATSRSRSRSLPTFIATFVLLLNLFSALCSF